MFRLLETGLLMLAQHKAYVFASMRTCRGRATLALVKVLILDPSLQRCAAKGQIINLSTHQAEGATLVATRHAVDNRALQFL